MGVGRTLELELTRTEDASRQARRWLEANFSDLDPGESDLDPGELETAKLLTSELVNNAVLHGAGNITLRAALDEHRLMVEVIDEGSGFERLVEEREFERLGGWGLTLVEAEASRWGVHEGTTHVWFELERAGPRIGPPP